MSEKNIKELTTYIKLDSPEEDGLVLEVDLISLLEKGQKNKYLVLSIGDGDEDPKGTISFYVKSKEEFENIKGFFGQLNWDAI